MNIEDVKYQYAISAAMYTIVYEEEHDRFLVVYDDQKELTYTENDGETCRKIKMDDELACIELKKSNMMWIEDIKKHYNWKQGDVIYLNTKQNCDGCFYVMSGHPEYYDVAIDDNGFVVKRYFQSYTFDKTSLIPSMEYIIRPSCVYNDYQIDYQVNALR